MVNGNYYELPKPAGVKTVDFTHKRCTQAVSSIRVDRHCRPSKMDGTSQQSRLFKIAMAGIYYLLDTFTNEIFRGNPTSVCILDKTLSVKTMHSLAKEFNAPVTAFVEPQSENEIYPIRYFTVTGEIPACGHATLGAAFVLHNQTVGTQITFETIEKIMLQTRKDNGVTFIEYPKFNKTDFVIPTMLMNALNIQDSQTNFFSEELQSLFIELKNETEVKQLSPDFKMLLESTDKIKEVVVMSKAENKNYDFVLRSFCPWIGIDEDPVTGSVHSVLGQFWQERLNKNVLVAFQASQRGGHIVVKQLQNTVEIGGHVEMIIEGRLKQ
jgi:PhzF family phenazine biosynthesis protein